MAYDRERDPDGNFARAVAQWFIDSIEVAKAGGAMLGILGAAVWLGQEFGLMPDEVEQFVNEVEQIIERYFR